MTRKEDFTMPWGREQPDSIVALTLAEKNYHAHRSCVMSQTTTIDTSNPNDNNPITDLFNSGKRPMLRRFTSGSLSKFSSPPLSEKFQNKLYFFLFQGSAAAHRPR